MGQSCARVPAAQPGQGLRASVGRQQARVAHDDRVVADQQRGVQVRPVAAAPADRALERFAGQVDLADAGAVQQARVLMERLKPGQARDQP